MVEASPGYQGNRARISLALSQFTVPLLNRIYQQFDGDFIAALVLGEIAHRNVEAWLNNKDNPEGPLYQSPERDAVMRPCNALSISEACGIPRETVRRKVVQMIEMGFIVRNEAGHLYLSATVAERFRDSTVEIIEALLTTARRLESLLANQPTPLGPLRLG